jgi:hypothetical protein
MSQMPERQNRNVRHLAYRDAQLPRTEGVRKTVDFHGAKGPGKSNKHGWPLPEPETREGEQGH